MEALDKTNELPFQNDMIQHLVANGWLLGKPEKYNRELALYPEDLLGFVQETQDAQWQNSMHFTATTSIISFWSGFAARTSAGETSRWLSYSHKQKEKVSEIHSCSRHTPG